VKHRITRPQGNMYKFLLPRSGTKYNEGVLI
jgi:hypothetical protein